MNIVGSSWKFCIDKMLYWSPTSVWLLQLLCGQSCRQKWTVTSETRMGLLYQWNPEQGRRWREISRRHVMLHWSLHLINLLGRDYDIASQKATFGLNLTNLLLSSLFVIWLPFLKKGRWLLIDDIWVLILTVEMWTFICDSHLQPQPCLSINSHYTFILTSCHFKLLITNHGGRFLRICGAKFLLLFTPCKSFPCMIFLWSQWLVHIEENIWGTERNECEALGPEGEMCLSSSTLILLTLLSVCRFSLAS